MFKVNNKNTKTMSMTPFSSDFIVNFKQVNISRVIDVIFRGVFKFLIGF